MEALKGKKRLIRWINGIMVFLLVLSALVLGLLLKDVWPAPVYDQTLDLNDGWTRINEDGSHEAVSGNFSIGKSRPVTFYRMLPDRLNSGQVLRIKCPYYSVDAYVDDELIYHAGPAYFGNIKTTLGNVFALIPMDRDYSAKKITITVAPRNYFYEVLIKDAAITMVSEYALQRIARAVPYFILCVILGMISLIAFLLFIVFRLSQSFNNRDVAKGFLHLGFLCLASIGWIVAEHHIFGMMTGRMALSGMINYVCFMLCPFLFGGILLYTFEKKGYFKALYIISELNFVVQMLLFFLGIIDLPEGIIVTQLVMVLLIIGMVVFGFLMMKDHEDDALGVIIYPTVCFVLFSAAAAFSYLLNGDWMIYVAMAMTCFAATVIIYLLINLWNALKTNIELDQVKKMAYLDHMTGLENRRAYAEYIDLENEKINSGESDSDLSAIVLDVNGLKKENDIFGHTAGDELITGAAECIKKTFGDIGKCFRTGGDEFVVLASAPKDELDRRLAELEDSLSAWKGKYTDHLSISVGSASRHDYPKYSLNKLLDKADKRMYKNKQHYYASLLEVDEDDAKDSRKIRYSDEFTLTKYTMPIIRQMAEVIPGGFFIYKEDEERRLIYQNRKVLEIYGCDTLEEFKELTGYTFEGMVYKDDFEKIQNSIDTQIDSEDGDGMDHVIYRIVRKDQTIRWVDDYGHFSHSEDYGDIYYVFISDITGRRDLEKILSDE